MFENSLAGLVTSLYILVLCEMKCHKTISINDTFKLIYGIVIVLFE